MRTEPPQRISRLTPLSEVLAAIGRLPAVAPREVGIAAARGCILAADATAPQALPVAAIALRDGLAVRSELTRDAGPYAPIMLLALPARVDAGERLPPDCDAVAPFDAIGIQGGHAEALASVAPGDGALPPGADVSAIRPMRGAGQMLRPSDQPMLAAAGITRVSIREPRVQLVAAGGTAGEMKAASLALVAGALQASGAKVDRPGLGTPADFESALREMSGDVLIGVGGTGSGRLDDAVQILARAGRVSFHGIGIAPGETSAFGFVGARPVLLLSGRIDAALAAWFLLGIPLIDQLASRRDHRPAFTAALARKVASAIGIAEFVPVRRDGHRVEPLATGFLPLTALTGADGYIVVPAESEGFPAEASVTVKLLS